MTTTFENAKVGDKVWSFAWGWGIITENNTFNSMTHYPIKVKFNNPDYTRSYYTVDGKLAGDPHRSLFWDEIKFTIPEQPKRKRKLTLRVRPYIDYTDRIYLACEEDINQDARVVWCGPVQKVEMEIEG